VVVIEADKKKPHLCGLETGHDCRRSPALHRWRRDCRLPGGHCPQAGDAVFIPAGTVHTLGNDIVVFEVQQDSDVTFRLYDWGHVDSKTKKPRPLQVDQAFACIDFGGSAGGLVTPA